MRMIPRGKEILSPRDSLQAAAAVHADGSPPAAAMIGGGGSLPLFILFATACCIVLGLDLLLLDRIPWAATVDDGTYAAAAFSFIRTGHAGLPMAHGLFGLERDLNMYGRTPAFFVGLSQLLLGPSARAARLPGLVAVALASWMVALVARRCGLSLPLSLAASLLWLISIPARMLAHSARPDPFLMLFTLLATLLLWDALDRGKARGFLLAGLVAGFTLEVHLVGSALMLALALAVLCLSPPGKRIWNAFLFSLATVPGMLAWLWIHAFSDFNLWRLQWSGLWQHWAPMPLLAGPSFIVRCLAGRYGGYFWGARYHRYLLEVPFLIAAVAISLSKSGPLRRLALVFVLFHGSLALVASGAHAGYMFAVYPLACVLMVATFFASRSRALLLAGVLLLAFHLVQNGYWIMHPGRTLPLQAGLDVTRTVRGENFLACDNLWFYFPDSARARSVVAASLAPFYAPGLTWAAAFEKYLKQEDVRFVVVDEVFEGFLTPSEQDFFNRSTTLVRQYDYGPRGWIRVYRLTLN